MPASLSEQENGGRLGGSAAMLPRSLGGCGAVAAPPPPPFRFSTPRQLIDWRALHALDLAALVRDTDIDALESVLDIVAHGDMEGEDARHLTPANAARAFRVAQLAVDYLLHVQDRLAADASAAKVQNSHLGRRPGGLCGHARLAVPQCNSQRKNATDRSCPSRATCSSAGRAGQAAAPRAAAGAQGEGAAGGAGGQPQGGAPPEEGGQDARGGRGCWLGVQPGKRVLGCGVWTGRRRRRSALLAPPSCWCSPLAFPPPATDRFLFHFGPRTRNLQTLALARQSAPPPPPPEPRVLERLVEVPDAAAARRAERLEAELAQLEEERRELQRWVRGVVQGCTQGWRGTYPQCVAQLHASPAWPRCLPLHTSRSNRKLADALEAAQQGAAAVAEGARREEREAAQQRLQAAVEEERRRHGCGRCKRWAALFNWLLARRRLCCTSSSCLHPCSVRAARPS